MGKTDFEINFSRVVVPSGPHSYRDEPAPSYLEMSFFTISGYLMRLAM
jgi:hypothetical protein